MLEIVLGQKLAAREVVVMGEGAEEGTPAVLAHRTLRAVHGIGTPDSGELTRAPFASGTPEARRHNFLAGKVVSP
jgi:hypothetical protein